MVDILLATYNGEKFVRKQIDSILAQDYREWILYIRDDGSTDSTPEILDQYRQRYPQKIRIVEDKLGNLGFCRNFKQLMRYSTSRYAMFCDQDDIWKKDKISSELLYMEKLEGGQNDIPALIFSDLEGIDENDKRIFESFIQKNKYEVEPILFSKLLFRNVVTGCTVMINSPLRLYMMQMPDGVKSHDHWISLVCLLHGGNIGYLNKPTVSYRQHSNNHIGDLSLTTTDKIRKLMDLSHYRAGKARSITYYRHFEQQIGLLKNECTDMHNTPEKRLLEALAGIWHLSGYKRIALLYRNHCFPNDVYLKMIMCMYYLIWNKYPNKGGTN